MTKYTWTDALRKRIYKRLLATREDSYLTPTVQDYLAACREEDVCLTYWHSDLGHFIAWCVMDHDTAVAPSLVQSMCHEWREAHEIAESTRRVFGRLSRWDAPGTGSGFIDPDAIKKEEER